MVLNGKEGLEWDVCVEVISLEIILEFKCLRSILDESGIDWAACSREVESRKRVAGAIGYLVNARDLQHECARVLQETLLVPVLMYGSETLVWEEKERSRINAVHIDNLKGLLGIRRMDSVLNAQIRELCRVMEG